jgi:hypothetical protein
VRAGGGRLRGGLVGRAADEREAVDRGEDEPGAEGDLHGERRHEDPHAG